MGETHNMMHMYHLSIGKFNREGYEKVTKGKTLGLSGFTNCIMGETGCCLVKKLTQYDFRRKESARRLEKYCGAIYTSRNAQTCNNCRV